jgi:uncharacterized RDD family membrane protein YckC
MAAREREYDDDEDRPRPKRRPSDEFEEDRPRPKRRPSDEYEEGEPPPRKRPRDDYDEEEEERPRRRSRDEYDDDEYEERPRRKRRRRDVDEEYAGFWARFAAVFIDGILINIVLFPLRLILPGTMDFNNPAPNFGMLALLNIITILVSWLYEAGMISSSWQATLGGKALRIKVTDLDGRPIGFAQATGRTFAKILSALICLIGYLMQPFTERKQALHDMIAGTLVVRDER